MKNSVMLAKQLFAYQGFADVTVFINRDQWPTNAKENLKKPQIRARIGEGSRSGRKVK